MYLRRWWSRAARVMLPGNEWLATSQTAAPSDSQHTRLQRDDDEEDEDDQDARAKYHAVSFSLRTQND
jgi:hypothetical protein